MTVRLRKVFIKEFNKLGSKQKEAWYKTLQVLKMNPYDYKLRRHKLKGKYEGMESIDVAPDLRALFIETEDRYTFYCIRNHNQLYS